MKKLQKIELLPWTAGGFVLIGISFVAAITLFASAPKQPQKVTQHTSAHYPSQTLGEMTEKRTVMLFNEAFGFKKKVITDPNLTKDQSFVQTKGVPGKRNATYEVIYTNGKETGRILLRQTILTKPIDEVLVKGSKQLTTESQEPQVQAAQTTKPARAPKAKESEPLKEIKKVTYHKNNGIYCVAPGEMFYNASPNVTLLDRYATKKACFASTKL